jgi:TetR/AcrR family tetracycline transcriptional repressor
MQLFFVAAACWISRYVVGCVLEEQASPVDGSIEQAQLEEAAKAYPVLGGAMAHYRVSGHEACSSAGCAATAA